MASLFFANIAIPQNQVTLPQTYGGETLNINQIDTIKIGTETNKVVISDRVESIQEILFLQDAVDLTDKLQLLGHADEGVRIAAIKSIHTNDLIAQKIILDHYDSEKSKAVRQVYKEQFPDFVARRHF